MCLDVKSETNLGFWGFKIPPEQFSLGPSREVWGHAPPEHFENGASQIG